MVIGIEKFREKFRHFTDCYTVIGGTACDILMGEADIEFRATKDIDMILLMEDRYPDFARVFWEYIKEGGYKCGWKGSEDAHFYRFTDPLPGYPVMIELFSRKPDYHLEADSHIIPIHIDDDISSLSAILLDDDFYEFMLRGRRVVADTSVLGAEYLIPFKMYAWLNLRTQKAAGGRVNDRDLKKHKKDVFRLLQIVSIGTVVPTTGKVHESIEQFLADIQNEDLHPEQLHLGFSKEEGISLLKQIYMV